MTEHHLTQNLQATTSSGQTYLIGQHPDLPPPRLEVGVIGYLRHNFFNSWLNSFLTILCLLFLWKLIPPLYQFFIHNAVWEAGSRNECREINANGACWAFIKSRIWFLTFGFYPHEERWRVVLAFVLLIVAVFPILYDKAPYRRQWFIVSLCYPLVGGWLLLGGLGLPEVETAKFGGIMLTFVLGVTAIFASLPLGILLALGRFNRRMPAVQRMCVFFIEVIRGVPLITLLIIASFMLNYFLPPGTNFNLLLRVLIMITLFAAVYNAEVIRGGLQAIPKGQFEGADSLGLSYWQSMRGIVLPQALKISIPGLCNNFIGLFMDSSLVLIIGMLDILGSGRASLADTKWNGLALEVYSFTALFYFICCFSMSRYSAYLERKLHTGYKR